ncbi:hypothetical protein AB6D11_01050 [Vibrio splendidus]
MTSLFQQYQRLAEPLYTDKANGGQSLAFCSLVAYQYDPNRVCALLADNPDLLMTFQRVRHDDLLNKMAQWFPTSDTQICSVDAPLPHPHIVAGQYLLAEIEQDPHLPSLLAFHFEDSLYLKIEWAIRYAFAEVCVRSFDGVTVETFAQREDELLKLWQSQFGQCSLFSQFLEAHHDIVLIKRQK